MSTGALCHLLMFLVVSLCKCEALIEDSSGVFDVIAGLNWTSGIQIMSSGSDFKGQVAKLSKMASEHQVFVLPSNDGSDSTGSLHHQKLPIVFYSANNSMQELAVFLRVLVNGIYPTEGVMFLTSYSLSHEIKDWLKNSGYSRAFFHYMIGASTQKVVRIQMFRHMDVLVMNEWTKESGSRYFQPRYDFHGAKYTMLGTTNDYPFLYVVPHPEDPTLASYSGGTNVECLDILRGMYNFSLEVRIQLDDNWGVSPVSGNLGKKKIRW